jgi:hypothetical protein
MNKKTLTALILSLVTLFGCAKTLPPITGGDFAGSDAAEIVVIRQRGGSQCPVHVTVDGEVVCQLPEWGNWSRFTLEPGLREFEPFCAKRGAKSEPKTFKIEARAKHYFRVHHRLADFTAPKMRVSQITELEASNLTSREDKYEYVPSRGD